MTEKAEIGLVKLIAQENMPISHVEKILGYLKEFIPDSKVTKEMTLSRFKATSILENQVYPVLVTEL